MFKMRVEEADPEDRRRAYRTLVRDMEIPADSGIPRITDRELGIMFDITINYVDDLVPRYMAACELIEPMVAEMTTSVLAQAVMLKLAIAQLEELRDTMHRDVAATAAQAGEGLKRAMKAMGISDAEIAGIMDELRGHGHG